MSIKSRGIDPHWNYMLALEADLVLLSRYVEFDEKNFSCFSIEIARVLIAAGAEVDVVCKQNCKVLNPASRARTIEPYRRELCQEFPDLASFRVLIPRFGLTLTPWEEWEKQAATTWEEWEKTDHVPAWWTAHNKVKHQRATHYPSATLKHALNAVAGLFVMVLHLHSEVAAYGGLTPDPQLLRVDSEHRGGEVLGDRDAGFCYRIPGPAGGKG